MGVRTMLAASVVLGAIAAHAQGAQRSTFTPAHSRSVENHHRGPVAGVPHPVQTVPISPIHPMSNPIAPMSNPIAPMRNPIATMVSPPFIRYDGIPTVVIPTPYADLRTPGYGHRGYRGGYSDYNAYDNYIPYNNYSPYDHVKPEEPRGTFRTPADAETERPDIRTPGRGPGRDTRNPDIPVAETPTNDGQDLQQPVINPQPRPRPRLAPPPIGASRSDVLSSLGSPWGRVTISGVESLYFDGGLVVVIREGRVSQVRE